MRTEKDEKTKLNIQLSLGILLTVAGLVLLFCGFYAPVVGEITNSVLVAYGEVSTFAGALIGIDYKYKYNVFKAEEEERKRKSKEEQE